jgi:5'(3')-deoxyribonucleotidase
MKKITLRVDDTIDVQIEDYNISNGINNKQESYRRILLSGLKNEMSFDRKKVIPFEREVLKELKLIRNLYVLKSDFSKEDIDNKQRFLEDEIKKLHLIKEL